MMIQGGNKCLVTELSLFAGHPSEQITFSGFSRKLTKGEQEVFLCAWHIHAHFIGCLNILFCVASSSCVGMLNDCWCWCFYVFYLGLFLLPFPPTFFILLYIYFFSTWNDRYVAFGM